MTTPRVGLGFDVHPYSSDLSRPLVLGGITFDGERGLAGHSDADVVAHALADALLGASGQGDLGTHFPDSDPMWSGADSLMLLHGATALALQAGWHLVNADVAIVLDHPRLAERRHEIEHRLSAIAGGPVSVKAKRTEGLGSLGRGEGIACWAVALLEALPGTDR